MKIIDATYASSKSGSSVNDLQILLHSLVTSTKPIYLFTSISKQYKKLIKRRRRIAYLARKKAAINAEKPDSSKKVKSPAKKAVRKKATPAPKAEPVAEKAKTEDVLGPDATAKETEDSSSSEESKE